MGKRCSAKDFNDKLRWGGIIVAGDIRFVEDLTLALGKERTLLGRFMLYFAGGKLPESTGEDDSTLLGKLFRLRWGNGSTGCILYSSRKHSYTLLRNIKTVGDALTLAGECLYTPLEY